MIVVVEITIGGCATRQIVLRLPGLRCEVAQVVTVQHRDRRRRFLD